MMLVAVGLAAGMLSLGGCMSSTVPYDPAGAVDTGTYPNLNIAPQPAAAQLMRAEKDQKSVSLTGARAAQQPGGAVPNPATTARLQRLAQTHAADTLQAIEGK